MLKLLYLAAAVLLVLWLGAELNRGIFCFQMWLADHGRTDVMKH